MSSSNRKKKLFVFLSHASEDKPMVRELCQRLKDDGFDPWLDEERILPGQDWDIEIEKAVEAADTVILCLSSNSVSKEGYIQREYKKALDYQKEKPEGTIFVIPVRLDNCEIPFFMRNLQCVDYPSGYDRLLASLNVRASTSISAKNSRVNRGGDGTKEIQLALEGSAEKVSSSGSRRRYLDSLDSARFSKQTTYESTRLLNVLYVKAQLFLALALGDTIVVSENQFFDLEGFLETFDELYHSAKKLKEHIDLPIRVAIQKTNKDMFQYIEKSLNNPQFVLSLWNKLNNDMDRRKLWADFFSRKQKPADRYILQEEKASLSKLWTALKYLTPEQYIIAQTIAPELIGRIKRVIALSDEDINDLYTGIRGGIHQRRYLNREEVVAAKEIRDVLKKIQERVGEIKTRSLIRLELTGCEEVLKEGVIALTDTIYNQTIGIGTRATLIQSSTFPTKINNYIKAGYALSTYLQDTSFSSENYTDWELYSLDYFENLEGLDDPRIKIEFVTMLDVAQKNTPWENLIEMQHKATWQKSLNRFRDGLARLQAVEENLSTGSMTKAMRSRLENERNYLESQLKKNWAKHANIISKLTANSFWTLTESEIIFSHPSYQFSIHLAYSFLKTKLDMEQDKDFKIWRKKDSFKGRLDERIDPVR